MYVWDYGWDKINYMSFIKGNVVAGVVGRGLIIFSSIFIILFGMGIGQVYAGGKIDTFGVALQDGEYKNQIENSTPVTPKTVELDRAKEYATAINNVIALLKNSYISHLNRALQENSTVNPFSWDDPNPTATAFGKTFPTRFSSFAIARNNWASPTTLQGTALQTFINQIVVQPTKTNGLDDPDSVVLTITSLQTAHALGTEIAKLVPQARFAGDGNILVTVLIPEEIAILRTVVTRGGFSNPSCPDFKSDVNTGSRTRFAFRSTPPGELTWEFRNLNNLIGTDVNHTFKNVFNSQNVNVTDSHFAHNIWYTGIRNKEEELDARFFMTASNTLQHRKPETIIEEIDINQNTLSVQKNIDIDNSFGIFLQNIMGPKNQLNINPSRNWENIVFSDFFSVDSGKFASIFVKDKMQVPSIRAKKVHVYDGHLSIIQPKITSATDTSVINKEYVDGYVKLIRGLFFNRTYNDGYQEGQNAFPGNSYCPSQKDTNYDYAGIDIWKTSMSKKTKMQSIKKIQELEKIMQQSYTKYVSTVNRNLLKEFKELQGQGRTNIKYTLDTTQKTEETILKQNATTTWLTNNFKDYANKNNTITYNPEDIKCKLDICTPTKNSSTTENSNEQICLFECSNLEKTVNFLVCDVNGVKRKVMTKEECQ